jgi:hypothetical protein
MDNADRPIFSGESKKNTPDIMEMVVQLRLTGIGLGIIEKEI